MSSKLKLLKVTMVFFIVCIISAVNLMTDNTVQADKSYKSKKHRQNCHKHWHKHHRDSAHRHKHCHHHKHEKQRRRHDGDHGNDRDYDDGHDRRHDDRRGRDRRDDDHSRADPPRLPVPPVPNPIKPPNPPTPWGIAKTIGKKVHFSKSDRRQIKRYYRKPARRLQMMVPPSPPPGIDNLARRGALMPPLAKVRGLPSRLKGKLSRLPSAHRYGHLGRMVIIYNKRTRIIKDVKRAF